MAFVHRSQLPFNLADLIESAMLDWQLSQRSHQNIDNEATGDFIVEAMDRYNLRWLDKDEATFDDQATQETYRECISSAMDHWLAATLLPQDKDSYFRPVGE